MQNFTLKKFVDVATEKVASRTREVDLLSQTLRKIRFEHEALARNQARVMSALSDASKMTEMLPSHNQIRAAVVSAAESSDDVGPPPPRCDVLVSLAGHLVP